MKTARFHESSNATQTVKEHLRSVGKSCMEIGSKIKLSNTCYIIGLLHDMGKLSDDFQNYIAMQMDRAKSKSGEAKVDHGVYGAKYIYEMYKDGTGIQKLTSQIIAFVICYHHGGLYNCVEKSEIPILKRMDKLSKANLEKAAEEFQKIFPDSNLIENLFAKACDEISSFLNVIKKSNTQSDNAFFEMHLLIKTLYSILIDSDWLDSYVFEVNKPYEKPNSLSKELNTYIFHLQKRLDKFKLSKPVGKMQKVVFEKRNEIAQDCLKFAKNDTGIYTLTVPTGGGKTLSSFIFALNHAKEKQKERIFYVAPYTAIIEQNADEIRQTLKCGNNLLEFHSNVISEENETAKIFSERWDYHFVFTTMVQFLNTIYAAPSQNIRRLQALANSIIIFDEIQSIPLHCISLFNSAINFLNKCLNCTIVLCTATQPILDEVPKPVNLSPNSEIVGNVKDAFDKLKRVDVIDKTIAKGFTYQETVDFLKDVNKTYPSILLIVNTVDAAENLFNLTKEQGFGGKVFYLSSNLCPSHRKQVIDSIKKSLEKREPVICISTQVIECGVDISFDTVIRSIAGVDSIAQAAGRCNRHGEREVSEAYIINLGEDFENTKKLLSIDIGKKKTIGVLDLYKQNPQQYDNSLLSTKAVFNYFMRFINEEKVTEQFDYPLPKKDTSIYELLSVKRSLINTYKANTGQNFGLGFCFQFKTARENFAVIENNTKTLIVPFMEGKDIIADLISSLEIEQKAALLKRAQHYSVNVFKNKFEKLQKIGAIISCDIEGVYLLREGFYDNETGIVMESKLDTLLL